MPEARRDSPAPWITAAVAGVVLAGLVVIYFALLVPYRRDHAPGGFSSTETSAVTAAGTEAANVLSYRRANFNADFQRALDGATGSLRSDLLNQKKRTLQSLTAGKYDLNAVVTNRALVGPAGTKGAKSYIVLVTVNGFQSTQPAIPKQSTLQLTVVQSGSKWLVSDIRSIGIS